ncbi:DUF397 domain-containing protein [Streptomyces toyocaensis]|uniref:DUF397 domain-containing protein n=1 Tax=Streptomyces toyocaensis TaxID=55952 RepID=UPI00099B40AF|nr:DUF397 domain-containing protein [Streptomyces toyocaensis]
MSTPDNWRRSSYSGGGDGNNCVEIAPSPTITAVRDSKAPAWSTLTFPTAAFAHFLAELKGPGPVGTGTTSLG